MNLNLMWYLGSLLPVVYAYDFSKAISIEFCDKINDILLCSFCMVYQAVAKDQEQLSEEELLSFAF